MPSSSSSCFAAFFVGALVAFQNFGTVVNGIDYVYVDLLMYPYDANNHCQRYYNTALATVNIGDEAAFKDGITNGYHADVGFLQARQSRMLQPDGRYPDAVWIGVTTSTMRWMGQPDTDAGSAFLNGGLTMDDVDGCTAVAIRPSGEWVCPQGHQKFACNYPNGKYGSQNVIALPPPLPLRSLPVGDGVYGQGGSIEFLLYGIVAAFILINLVILCSYPCTALCFGKKISPENEMKYEI
jgi:hypothetical protein